MPRRLDLLLLHTPHNDLAFEPLLENGFTCLENGDFGDGKRWVRSVPPGAETGSLLAHRGILIKQTHADQNR